MMRPFGQAVEPRNPKFLSIDILSILHIFISPIITNTINLQLVSSFLEEYRYSPIGSINFRSNSLIVLHLNVLYYSTISDVYDSLAVGCLALCQFPSIHFSSCLVSICCSTAASSASLLLYRNSAN